MKLRFVRLICVAILWLSFSVADAQPYHRLTIDDFQGIPGTNNDGTIAYTNCYLEFGYIAKKEKNYYVLDFTIRLAVDNDKSWMDKKNVTTAEMLAEILKHEQGHYNIAYLEQQEILRTVSKTVFYADYKAVAKDIFDRIDAKYQQLNLDYDEGTQHMTNREQQHSWDVYFRTRLGAEYLAQN